MTLITKDINKAIEFLNDDQLIAIPTETVYGLAGNIYSENTIKAIFNLKKRPLTNPLIVHIHSIDLLKEVADEVSDLAYHLAHAFWPGPLTLLLKKNKKIPNYVTANKETVAVRIPNHELTLELLSKLDYPLAAPSANPFGSISPTESAHVYNYFNPILPLILDGGTCKNGIESTIIGFENDKPIVYRLGSIPIELIVKEIGAVEIKNQATDNPDAPGMLSKHYAPKTNTLLTDDLNGMINKYEGKRIGVISFDQTIENHTIYCHQVLSQSGNLSEAAANLYAALHLLDTMKLDVIIAQKFPNHDLGRSINDRLLRATKK
jgi:L-threonylcarbamoyladenylate synthase